MIDITNLPPNWREIQLNYMSQLAQMIAQKHSQSESAKDLLEIAHKELAEFDEAVRVRAARQ